MASEAAQLTQNSHSKSFLEDIAHFLVLLLMGESTLAGGLLATDCVSKSATRIATLCSPRPDDGVEARALSQTADPEIISRAGVVEKSEKRC